jgi:hypothetical protein
MGARPPRGRNFRRPRLILRTDRPFSHRPPTPGHPYSQPHIDVSCCEPRHTRDLAGRGGSEHRGLSGGQVICIRPSSSFGRVDRPHCGSGGIRGCEPDDESATKQHRGGVAGGLPRPCHPRLRHRDHGRRLRPRKDPLQPSPRLTSRSPTPMRPRNVGAKLTSGEPASSSPLLWTRPVLCRTHGTKPLVSRPHGASHWCCGGSRLPHRKPDNHPLSGFLHAQHITHRPLGWPWLVMTFAR